MSSNNCPLEGISVFRILFFFMALGFATSSSADTIGNQLDVDGYSAKATYLRNYDGDTIRVDIPGLHPLIGKNIPIRVRGIDTPEIRGKCPKEESWAERAKGRVRELLVKHPNIVLEGMERGKYFRIVATVKAGGIDIGGLLVEESLAVPYNGGRKTADWCYGN